MVDELIYSSSPSRSRTAAVLVRDVASNGYGFVYPVLIDPLPPVLVGAAGLHGWKDIDSVLMSLAAVLGVPARPSHRATLARTRRCGADGGGAVARLHRHADHGERLLPALPDVRLLLVLVLERPRECGSPHARALTRRVLRARRRSRSAAI